MAETVATINARRVTMIWGFSLLSAALIAAFWGIWYLVVGSVPVVSSVQITSNWTYDLPFAVSRWWDVVIGPILSVLIVWSFTYKSNSLNDYFVFGLGLGLVSALLFGLAFGLSFGLSYGLSFGLGYGLVYGLIYLCKVITYADLW